jgi:rare lipoprotein A
VLDTLPLTDPTTTTTVPPPPTTTTTAPKPKPKPVPTTTTAPKPSVTTAPVTVPPIVGTSQTGKATWYNQEPGVCAHRSLPFGTVVTVTNTGNGSSVTCTVGDRGPFVVGSIIDLAPDDFDQLAARSAGVVAVTINW